MPATKVATCNYCGTRAALVLTGETRHELACSSCGAPLHDLKQLPRSRDGATAPAATPARPARKPSRIPDEITGAHRARRGHKTSRKRRKPRGRKILSELFDVVEDIFD